MTAARSSSWRRNAAGARASRRLLRWPSPNYFAELEPRSQESHPVDVTMARDPDLRRIRRRAKRCLERLQASADSGSLLDFEAERNHLDSARVEVAYNLGFENGLLAGRAEGLRRSARRARDPAENRTLSDLWAVIAGAPLPAEPLLAVLQELAWAFALGASAPRRPRRSR
jgi:hypothetical protein